MLTSTRPLGGSDAEFRDLCQRFRALEARKAVDEAHANFEQARLIREARVRLKVPVVAICDALELSPQTVNTYRNVAERIDETLFRQLLEARRADGLALFPWSIIAQIARLAGKDDREELIKNVRRYGWRTRGVQGYVSVQRSETAARDGDAAAGSGRGGRAGGLAGRTGPDDAGCEDVSPVVGDLASRMEMLLKDLSRTVPPTYILIAVAGVASRMIAEAARADDGERHVARELRAAREALDRCATIAADVRNSIQRRLVGTRADLGSDWAVTLRPESAEGPHRGGH